MDRRFVRFPTDLLEALIRTRLSGLQWRILLWVLRQTYGWNRPRARFTWYGISKDLGVNRGGIVRAGRRLMKDQWLNCEAGTVGIRTAAALGGTCAERQRLAMPSCTPTDAASHVLRCSTASFFPRAKDSSKDRSKKYRKRRAETFEIGRDDASNGASSTHPPASEDRPVPGKYEGLSEN